MRGKPDPNSILGVANPNQSKDRILALNDISLEVNGGEVLGIIGANGAGKSTLLKILSKVTAPTSGTIKYKGRIASLLEVGTGFHSELTGRENIYLNGAINGMNIALVDHQYFRFKVRLCGQLSKKLSRTLKKVFLFVIPDLILDPDSRSG